MGNREKKNEISEDSAQLQELKGLLELWTRLPEDRKKSLMARLELEAAGEILTEEAVEKEKKAIMRLFSGVKDTRKKNLIERKAKETAFQALTMREAKESIMIEGLQKEVVNGSQRYPKENPAVATYDKYSRAYNANIDKLIDYLPPQETKKRSKLLEMRNG